MLVLTLITWSYTTDVNAPASIYAFPWMGTKSTTSFILIVLSFTCRPNKIWDPSFTCAPTQGQLTYFSKLQRDIVKQEQILFCHVITMNYTISSIMHDTIP